MVKIHLAMVKVKQIDDISIDSYGGLQFFHNFIEKTNFEKIIEQELGSRPAQAQYSYKNVIITFIANCLAGGSYTEDINILRSKQASLAGASYCSSDTFTRVIRQFIDMDHMELKESGKGTETEFFFNKPLNQILLQSYDKYFRKEGYNILDHDHTKLFTNKPDAKSCYKGRGYYASVFSTDQIPLYLSMQSGNATPKSDLIEVLRQGFEAMKETGLSFDIFRADGACYSEGVIQLVLVYFQHYIIRSQKSQFRQQAIDLSACKYAKIGDMIYRVFEEEDVFAEEPCRRIYYQVIKEEKDLFSDQEFSEIISNLPAEEFSTEQVITLYFARGAEERMFDEMKNDFLLAHLPFSEAPYNLCYAIIVALGLLLFRAFKKFVHGVVGQYIRPKMRIKQVLFRLFAFPARMIYRSRRYTYNFYCRQKELKPLIRWVNH